MSLLQLRLEGDPVLRTRTDAVDVIDDDLRGLATGMAEVMYTQEGVGLAANQVGITRSVFVNDCEGEAGVVVNPRLEHLSEEVVVEAEGCLSVPGQQHLTPRASSAVLVGTDLEGAPVRIEASGYLARCFQHEVDHLAGRLYLDRVLRAGRR